MNNPFESGERKAIPAVLIYLFHRNAGPHGGPDADRVLMLHRNAAGRVGDYHAGKWNGLGGKCEADESFAEAARREVLEESGIALPLESFKPLGFLQFPNFKAHKSEDWLVTVWVARVPDEIAARPGSQAPAQGQPWRAGPEGDLHWVPAAELQSLNLWPGDRYFLPFVVEQRPFFGTLWYDGPSVVRHSLQPLG